MVSVDWVSLFFKVNGRIERKEFWIGFAILAVLNGLLQLLVFAAVNPSDVAAVAPFAGLLLLYPSIAVFAKRQHDRGRPALWLLIALTGVGAIWLLLDSGIYEGEQGENQFGPVPIQV